jgi:zinc and cadmium transporter
LTAILGSIIGLWLAGYVSGAELVLVPLAAGGFIYIAASDLIPEMHKETKISKSLIQIISFLVGIAILFALLFLE